MEFIIKTLRTLFFSLDKIIYGFIDDVYGLLLQLSRTSIFTQDTIHEFSERIYALIGIFMLFKVSISLINYVLNPDDFIDKEKGLASIVKRIILALVMIVLVPYIFSEAYEVQTIILEENTIMNLVFGSPSSNDNQLPSQSYAESAGSKIQFTVLYAFAQPNYDDFASDEYDLLSCRETYAKYTKDENSSRVGEYKFRKLPTYNGNESTESRFIYELNPACFGEYDAATDTYVAGSNASNGKLLSLFEKNDAATIYQDYAQGVAQQSFSLFFKKNVMIAKETGEEGRYFINYKFGISTAVGVAILYLLLMFCIDIAVRSIKLGFLQMIAPIPILSYCDPKSGKDGMFKKWTDMCVKTYLELFMRLAALFFGIYVISLIGTFRDVITGEVVSGWTVSIFMIVGVLIFIKKLPEILKEVLNIKSDAKFTLNPLKKLENEMLGGKQLIGAGAAGLAGAAAFGSNAVTGFTNNKGLAKLKAIPSAVAGGLSAAGRGMVGAAKGEKFGKNFANSYGAAMQAKQSRADRVDDEVGWVEMMTSKAQQKMGVHTQGEKVKAANDKLQAIQDSYKAMQNAAVGNDRTKFKATIDKKEIEFEGIKGLEKFLDEVKKTTINRNDYATDSEYLDAVKKQQGRIKDLEDAKDSRLNDIAIGATTTGDAATDQAIKGNYQQMVSTANEVNSITSSIDSNIGKIDISKDAKTINGQAKGVSYQVSGSKAAQHATTVDQYGAKKGQK